MTAIRRTFAGADRMAYSIDARHSASVTAWRSSKTSSSSSPKDRHPVHELVDRALDRTARSRSRRSARRPRPSRTPSTAAAA